MTDSSARKSVLGVHVGNVLAMVANKYPSLELTLVEMVQNAIDASASNVAICIDRTARLVIVLDNGLGVTEEQFEEALASVAETQKRGGNKTQIGRFGIGLVSPLTKCERFTFVSQSRAASFPICWTFVQDAVTRQRNNVNIPKQNLSRMPVLPNIFTPFLNDLNVDRWQTMVTMHGLTIDRTVGLVDLDRIENAIRDKLGLFMHQRGVQCRVVIVADGKAEVRDIVPQTYLGEPLPVIKLDGGEAGEVTFELYRARKINGRRQGKIVVTEAADPYPVSWREFMLQVRGGGWDSTCFKVLGSGYFEGSISAKNITLMPERNKFEWNATLQALLIAIDDWYQTYGKHQFEIEQELQRSERYKELSLQVAGSVRDMLRRPEFQSLAEGLEQITFGHIGEGHGRAKKNLDGTDDRPSTRSGQGGAGKSRQPGCGPKSKGRGDNPTRDGDKPFGAMGDAGNQRRVKVEGDSLGLWIEVVDFPVSTRLWSFDVEEGVLSFNSGNSIWAMLDGDYDKQRSAKNDRWLVQLQTWVVLQVLVALTMPAEQFETIQEMVDRMTKPYVHVMITSTK